MLDQLARIMARGDLGISKSATSRRRFLKSGAGAAAAIALSATSVHQASAASSCQTGTFDGSCPQECGDGGYTCSDGSCGSADCNKVYAAGGTFINEGITNCRYGPSRCYAATGADPGVCGDGISINAAYFYGDCVTNVCNGNQSSTWYRTSVSGCWLARAYSNFDGASCC